MNEVTLTIDGKPVTVPAGTSVLAAAGKAGIDIPHLCYDPRVEAIGSCRLCTVKIEGARGLVSACGQQVAQGMKVVSEDDELGQRRKHVLELLLSEHCSTCIGCDKSGSCRLQDYAYRYGADQERFGHFEGRHQGPNYTTLNQGILYDADKCIRCGLCVKYCETVQMSEALTFAWRGNRMVVTTPGDVDLNETGCELCGGCIRVCPTGAMLDKSAVHHGRCSDLEAVRTTCSYCGVGCQMDLMVDRRKNRIVRVTAEPGSPINDGNLCVKGHFGFEFVHSPARLQTPLVRRNGELQPASWDEALAVIAERFGAIRARGADQLAFISSARCTNEENYLVQKIARAVVGTNNVDNCATSCHAPSVAGLAESFGSGAMTNSTAEIKDCKVLFLIGANPTEAHPIFGLEMKRALRRGAKLIVADPRRTWMAQHAHLHIQHRPGTDNLLLNALMRCILDEGLADRAFVESRCEGFEEFAANLRTVSVEDNAAACGVPVDTIREAARLYAKGQPSGIYYTLGITEHACGTDNVKNVANLAMLCGQIGKWASGVNPMRGQNNVQGACDMGAMPHKLPGYQNWNDPAARARFEQAWGVPLPATPGLKIPQQIEAAAHKQLAGMFVLGQDLVATEPNQAAVIAHLQSLECLVVQEIFLTETAKLAHVVLPGATFAEKDGTFASSERRVQLVRKAIDPPGQAKADWEALLLVAEALGKPMHYESPAAIYAEMASLSPMFAGISHARIAAQNGVQWPCPSPEHPGTRFLHEGRFTRGKGRFHAIHHTPPREEPSPDFPLILSTGRTLYNYNCGSMTRKSKVIDQKDPANFVEIHPDTAARYGIAHGDQVAVRTRRGRVTGKARVGERVRPDTIWMPFHFAEESANLVTNDVFDPVTATAEYKCCAAVLERVGPGR